MWPYLSRLPKTPLRLLDAGCGTGEWAIEIAARRPEWLIVGIDNNQTHLDQALKKSIKLSIKNIKFFHTNFLDYEPTEKFDIVLSAMSAHYLVQASRGRDLFFKFSCWLKEKGELILLGPRMKTEASFVFWLPKPEWHQVFSGEQLRRLCEECGLRVQILSGEIGYLGSMSRQIKLLFKKKLLLRGIWPLELALSFLDKASTVRGKSLMWLLIGRRD